MNVVQHKTSPFEVCFASILLTVVFGYLVTSLPPLSAQKPSNTVSSFKRMADGKRWMTLNLNVNIVPSYCYEDAELKCRQYGRLYTWDSAQRACQSLGDGWRLPTDDEWRAMAKHYGGVSEDSDDRGKAAYKALLTGGNSGFNALLGGGRSQDGQYARLGAHGFYWTASEIDPATGWSYNFGGSDKHSIVRGAARRSVHFPFGVSRNDNSKHSRASVRVPLRTLPITRLIGGRENYFSL